MGEFFWPADLRTAKDEQLALRDLVTLVSPASGLLDFANGLAIGTAYEENTKTAIAVGVWFRANGTYSYRPARVVALTVDFPYVPGYLAFRVGPAVCRMLDELTSRVRIDVLLMDGQGVAHELWFGLASHIGVLYNLPSIGVTRTPLFGRFELPPAGQLTASQILDPRTRDHLGHVLLARESCQPCFVSPGHRATVSDALALVRATFGSGSSRGCFPPPLARAHMQANAVRRRRWKEAREQLERLRQKEEDLAQ